MCKIYTLKDYNLDYIIDFSSRERNPVIGGEKLDLHHLYFLVTQQGGIEKEILDGKWREVIVELNISQTITNRSFVVKNHYFKLLFQYEQVYYFRCQGPIVTPPVSVRQRSYPRFQFVNNSGQAMSLLPQPVFNQGSESSGSVPDHLLLGESQPEDGAHSFPTNMAAHVTGENMPAGGRSVHNNLGNVNTGSHILHGVLQSQSLPAFSLSDPSTSAVHPQPCWSAYSLFLEERISMFRNLPSQSMGELIRLIEESWGRLTEAQRGAYIDRERMDKERYRRELNEYQERIRRTQSK